MDIELKMGFRSSFNFVPEKYSLSDSLLEHLKKNGFQVCVHGLKHDGKLFSSKKVFEQRAERINHYLAKWGSTGFTAPSMHHNLEWMLALNITHSTATFDTDPYEPQPDAAGTIFPYWVRNGNNSRRFLEMPYTLPQDHLLFIILRERDTEIWKKKLDWIAGKGGLVLLNTHTDYMNFSGNKYTMEEYDVKLYIEFLNLLKEKYVDRYWHALAQDVASFFNSQYRN